MSINDPQTTRYHQLAETLAAAIHQGTFTPGSRLPAIRRCAASHQVSVNTVLTAYGMLEDRGLIEARPQSGYYVRDALPSLTRQAQPRSHVRSPSSEKLDLIDTVFAAQNHAEFTNISLACPQNSDFFPTAKLSGIMRTLLKHEPDLIARYALPPGSLRLRREIARRSLDLGIHVSSEEVTLTHGCMEALQLALRAVTRPGDCVGVETPTYFYLFPLLASLGLKVLEIPTDPQYGLSLDALELVLQEQRIQALIAMPNVQNPLGSSMTLEAKKRLARLVNHYQVPLLEDGLYAELQFCWPLSPAVKAFDEHGWVLYCASFTKTVAPDYRVGWIAAGRFSDALARLKAVSSMSESRLLSETLGHFLESGGYDHHLRSLRRRYAAQLEEARGIIARHFPQGTRATRPSGGFVFWVELPGGVDCVALFHRLLQEKICLTPGALYTLGERCNNALRLSCCYPFDQRYTWALQRTGALACEMSGIAAGVG
ncbi:aminotransferase class I/II-fold pyridoxal phosphate-dependent enzyme [Erwinia sp. E602]|uniref:aminotransferase-like domain-containing protein n=1 Tax=unclassified Erwinia TaxID=2622719 RepID=UPI0006FFE794|nr:MULTISPECIES: PLP-dependent aminotransferase family protein [unclassified Erwinia]KQN63321.1 GntR family transcriptional regulator [Erwinia sp. Leaf53]PLV57997.1 GntR family transcriptional regulator [Erwinia sp. B116]QUG77650.1 aminotransferase class I/II-fold pyridoxal phosphate-dependent enzyme [Erwinia sp. E602]